MSFSRLAILFVGLLLSSASHLAHADVTFVHTNHQGTPVASTNAQGQVIGEESTTPFGESLNPPTSDNQPAYTGHVRDGSTGLVYMQARYYDPVVGRFLSTDPVDLRKGGVNYFNRYAYTANNPVNLVDPTGEYFAGNAWRDRPSGDGNPNVLLTEKQKKLLLEKLEEMESLGLGLPQAGQDEYGFQWKEMKDGTYGWIMLPHCNPSECAVYPDAGEESFVIHFHTPTTEELAGSRDAMQAIDYRNQLPSKGDVQTLMSEEIPIVTVGVGGGITVLERIDGVAKVRHLMGPESPFIETFNDHAGIFRRERELKRKTETKAEKIP